MIRLLLTRQRRFLSKGSGPPGKPPMFILNLKEALMKAEQQANQASNAASGSESSASESESDKSDKANKSSTASTSSTNVPVSVSQWIQWRSDSSIFPPKRPVFNALTPLASSLFASPYQHELGSLKYIAYWRKPRQTDLFQSAPLNELLDAEFMQCLQLLVKAMLRQDWTLTQRLQFQRPIALHETFLPKSMGSSTPLLRQMIAMALAESLQAHFIVLEQNDFNSFKQMTGLWDEKELESVREKYPNVRGILRRPPLVVTLTDVMQSLVEAVPDNEAVLIYLDCQPTESEKCLLSRIQARLIAALPERRVFFVTGGKSMDRWEETTLVRQLESMNAQMLSSQQQQQPQSQPLMPFPGIAVMVKKLFENNNSSSSESDASEDSDQEKTALQPLSVQDYFQNFQPVGALSLQIMLAKDAKLEALESVSQQWKSMTQYKKLLQQAEKMNLNVSSLPALYEESPSLLDKWPSPSYEQFPLLKSMESVNDAIDFRSLFMLCSWPLTVAEVNRALNTMLPLKGPFTTDSNKNTLKSTNDPSELFKQRLAQLNLTKRERLLSRNVILPNQRTRYADIAGNELAKETLYSHVTLPLLMPEVFSQGVLKRSVTGVLLFGPPGTGKSMLARAAAAESGATFLRLSASQLYAKYVGESEKQVAAVFSLAKKLKPCVLFLDEMDAFLGSRDAIGNGGWRTSTLNEFMALWDGLDDDQSRGVLVLGATNRPFALDDAALRRLPHRILVDLPDAKGRLTLLELLFKEDSLSSDMDLKKFAEKAHLYSGSDLKNVAQMAALFSLKEAIPTVTPNTAESSPRFVIQTRHLELAFRRVPPTLSEQTESLIQLRQWNDLYGERKHASAGGKKMGLVPFIKV